MMNRLYIILAAIVLTGISYAGLPDYLATVGSPDQGESGPTLWYQTSGDVNSGSAAADYTLTEYGDISKTGTDAWGNSSAFGLVDGETIGASITNSESFASGANGTVCFLFKTPSAMTTFDSLFNAGDYSAPLSTLELGNNKGTLRLTTQTGGAKSNTNIGTLTADTWYYFAMTWDTSLSSDDLTYYLGEIGSTLASGSKDIDSAGASNKPIYVGGRSYAGYAADGGYFQSVAVYTETLSAASISNQFTETTNSLAAYLTTVGTPSEGESAPALWYQTTPDTNSGTAGTYTFSIGGDISKTGTDYWANDSAFGLEDSENLGAGIPDSESFASGDNGTVCFLFKTPDVMSGFDSLFNAGAYGTPASVLEVGLNNGILRLSTRTDEADNSTNIATLDTNTWYYFAMTWDTSLSTNDLTYYYGAAGDTLSSGTKTIDSAGASSKPIYIGGREYGTYGFNGGYFQSVAVYSETLSSTSINAQFDALFISNIDTVGMTQDGTDLIFSWGAQSQGTYILQSRPDLTTGSWSNIVTNISGIDGTLFVTNAMDGDQAFYRIILQ